MLSVTLTALNPTLARDDGKARSRRIRCRRTRQLQHIAVGNRAFLAIGVGYVNLLARHEYMWLAVAQNSCNAARLRVYILVLSGGLSLGVFQRDLALHLVGDHLLRLGTKRRGRRRACHLRLCLGRLTGRISISE